MKVLLISAFIVFVLLGDGEGIAYNSQKQELFVYQEQVKVVHQILASECPDYVEVKRDINDPTLPYHVTVARKVYEKLIQKLIECRQRNSQKKNVPKECLTATNLTESWRLDHNGSALTPGGPHSSDSGYACDFHKDLQWFRFTGSGGSRLMNSCPKEYSCGTGDPYWSDGEPPKVVGVPITITAYLSRSPRSSCKYKPDTYNRKVEVMRCSLNTDHDLIYKYMPDNISISAITNGGYYRNCANAFCGMI